LNRITSPTRRDDVDELLARRGRHEKLHAREANAADDRGGQDALERLEAAHDHDEIGRDKDRDRCAKPADPGAEQVIVDTGDG
jgi:hypothetical protein